MSTTALAEKPKVDISKLSIRQFLGTDAIKTRVAEVMPKHLKPERFLRIAMAALTKTPKLADCTQSSFLTCLLNLSAAGLEPDGRRAHLIPYGKECTLIIDYKGLAELAMRSGVVANLHADIVCENDDFEYDSGRVIRHKIDFRKPRGEAYAAYAICRFKDGTEKAECMTKDEIEGIRKRSRAGNSGPWQSDWTEMAKKTAFRRLSKWLPLSAEFRDAVERDDEDYEQLPEREVTPQVSAPKFLKQPEPEPESYHDGLLDKPDGWDDEEAGKGVQS
jgi:recombination protein RecT